MPRPTDRSPEAQAYRHLYNRARWRGRYGVRAQQLTSHPLCEMCLKAGTDRAATVCDHVDPKSKQTEEGFFAGPFQSLCADHHDANKQQEEAHGFSLEVGLDGVPIDPNHPFNR